VTNLAINLFLIRALNLPQCIVVDFCHQTFPQLPFLFFAGFFGNTTRHLCCFRRVIMHSSIPSSWDSENCNVCELLWFDYLFPSASIHHNWKQVISNFFSASLRHTEIHIFVFSKICDRGCHSVESLKIRQWYYVTNFILKAFLWLSDYYIHSSFCKASNSMRTFKISHLQFSHP